MLQFRKSISIDGKPYKAGDTVEDGVVPAGTLESCLRLGWIAKVKLKAASKSEEPPAPDQSVPETSPETNKPVKKPKAPRQPKKK